MAKISKKAAKAATTFGTSLTVTGKVVEPVTSEIKKLASNPEKGLYEKVFFSCAQTIVNTSGAFKNLHGKDVGETKFAATSNGLRIAFYDKEGNVLAETLVDANNKITGVGGTRTIGKNIRLNTLHILNMHNGAVQKDRTDALAQKTAYSAALETIKVSGFGINPAYNHGAEAVRDRFVKGVVTYDPNKSASTQKRAKVHIYDTPLWMAYEPESVVEYERRGHWRFYSKSGKLLWIKPTMAHRVLSAAER